MKETEKEKEQMQSHEVELINVLIETQQEYTRSNKMKDKIIILLIVVLFLQTMGFLIYESQFEVVTTEGTTETKTIELDSSGDGANTEYNEVIGNMYKDSATHNEGIGD